MSSVGLSCDHSLPSDSQHTYFCNTSQSLSCSQHFHSNSHLLPWWKGPAAASFFGVVVMSDMSFLLSSWNTNLVKVPPILQFRNNRLVVDHDEAAPGQTIKHTGELIRLKVTAQRRYHSHLLLSGVCRGVHARWGPASELESNTKKTKRGLAITT